jgi:hypothetical protein
MGISSFVPIDNTKECFINRWKLIINPVVLNDFTIFENVYDEKCEDGTPRFNFQVQIVGH